MPSYVLISYLLIVFMQVSLLLNILLKLTVYRIYNMSKFIVLTNLWKNSVYLFAKSEFVIGQIPPAFVILFLSTSLCWYCTTVMIRGYGVLVEWYWQGKTEGPRKKKILSPSTTSSNTNPRWTGLEWNMGPWVEKSCWQHFWYRHDNLTEQHDVTISLNSNNANCKTGRIVPTLAYGWAEE